MTKRLLLIIVSLLVISKTVSAQPVILDVSGDPIHGGAIVISGDQFGLKEPAAPVLWDDGASNQSLANNYDGYKPKNAQQGAYYNIAYRPAGFRNIAPPNSRVDHFIGGAHAIDIADNGDERGYNVCLGKNISSHNYYINYYYRLDPNFDEENHPDRGDNMKELVLSNSPGQFYPSGQYAFGYSSWCEAPDSNNRQDIRLNRIPISEQYQGSPYSCSNDEYAVSHNNPVNDWIKMEWTGQYNHVADAPQISLTTYPDGHRTYRSHYGDGMTVMEYARGLWMGYPKENDLRFIGIGGFARVPRRNNGINSFRYFAAVYMDNTHSRVMLGDNQEYSECTIMEPQIPSAWNDNSITVETNLGNLPDEGTAYLFVFDDSNDHNQTGYPIEIGIRDQVLPNSPNNLRVVD